MEIGLTNQLTTEETKEAFAEGILTAAKQKGTIWSTLQAKADAGSARAKKILSAAQKKGLISINAETGAVIANTVAWYANPIMWIAVIIIAIVAAIAILVASIINLNKRLDEANKTMVENSKKTLEMIEANQELADSIDNLIEKYEDLKATGESVYDTLESLEEQIPKLIDSYSELENSLNIDLNLDNLKMAWEKFKITEDTSTIKAELDRINKEVAEAELRTAQLGASAAKDRMITAARKGDGRLKADGNYVVRIGGVGNLTRGVSYNGRQYVDEEAASSTILKEKMGSMWNGSKIEFNANDTASVIQAYEKMQEAKLTMENNLSDQALAYSDTYRELKRELEEMSESYADVLEFSTQIAKSAKADFNAGEDKKLKEEFDISTLDKYKQQRTKIIEELQKKYEGLTQSQAEALLASSEVFSKYETAMELFKSDGRIAEDLKTKGTLTVQRVQEWYNTLPEDDKTLFMAIDFTEVGSIDEAKEKLEEAREKAASAAIAAEAKTLGYEETLFSTYTEILVDNNKALT